MNRTFIPQRARTRKKKGGRDTHIFIHSARERAKKNQRKTYTHSLTHSLTHSHRLRTHARAHTHARTLTHMQALTHTHSAQPNQIK